MFPTNLLRIHNTDKLRSLLFLVRNLATHKPRNLTDFTDMTLQRFGTWNLRSLQKCGAFESVTKALMGLKIGLCAVQETRWPGQGHVSNNGYTLFYSGDDRGRKILGTGFLINDNLKYNVLNFLPVYSRLCVIRIKGHFTNISVVNGHAPTEDSSEIEKDDFYETLDRVYSDLPSYDVKIVVGDFNARLGKEPVWQPYVGKESLHETTSENGIRLASFAIANALMVKSTMFPHRNTHKQTWRSPDGRTTNQIDHVVIDRRHHSCVTDVRSFRGADGDSDHYLVAFDFRHRIATYNRFQRQRRPMWNIDRLKNNDIKDAYQLEINNRFAVLQDIEDPNEMWMAIKDNLSLVADKVLGKRRRRRKAWFNEVCQEAIERRKVALQHYLIDNTKKEEYECVRRCTNTCLRREKRIFLKDKIESIETNRAANNGREMYRTIKRMRGIPQQGVIIRDERGNMLTNPKDSLEQWRKYFERLLNVHSDIPDYYANPPIYQTAEPFVEEPSLTEVEKAVNMLKDYKAPGIDNLPSELFKQGGNVINSILHNLILKIWRKECIPKEWKVSIITPVYKKGDRTLCENYRGISLLTAGYKVLSNILLMRLTPYAEDNLGDYQAGFRRNRSTTDQLFTLRQVFERCWEYGVDVHNIFVDFSKAYDSIIRIRMWEALEDLGIPKKLRRMVQVCVNESIARVKVEGDLSDPFEVLSGVKQGDGLSPLLFNLVLEKIVRSTEDLLGGIVLGRRFKILGYADDLNVMSYSMEEAEAIVYMIEKAANEMGLRINEEKTKAMSVGRARAYSAHAF